MKLTVLAPLALLLASFAAAPATAGGQCTPQTQNAGVIINHFNCVPAAPAQAAPKPQAHHRPQRHEPAYVEPRYYSQAPTPYVVPAVYQPPQAYVPAGPAVAGCPSGYSLTIYAWDINSLRPDLRAEAEGLIQAAMGRPTQHAALLQPYSPDDVSRTMGRRIRETGVLPAPVNGYVQINYLDPREPTRIIQSIGNFPIRPAGDRSVAHIPLSGDPRNYVVETIFPASFVSPTATDRTGSRRLRLFGHEWGKGNPANPCDMPETGLVPLSGGPPMF